MKKNITIALLLAVYAITFIVLFIRLRSMSSIVLEELTLNNIYYILGIMFISGIALVFYLLMKGANSTEEELEEKLSEDFIFSDDLENKLDPEAIKSQDLDLFKTNLSSVFELEGLSSKEKMDKVLVKICNHFEISQALLYFKEMGREQLTLQAAYAFVLSENDTKFIISGEGLNGQAALEGVPYYIKEVPEGYMKVISGLGESIPKTLLIIPCLNNGEVNSLFELSSLKEYSKNTFDEIVSICQYVSILLTK